MIYGEEKERTDSFVWPPTGAPTELQIPHHSRRIGVHARLRSKGLDKKIPREGIDEWCYRSVELVAKPFRSYAANQRRIRYFGFEATHEQV